MKLELENLNISDTYLRETEDDILAGAVIRIKTVDLKDTQLTTSQATAIFRAILTEENLGLENLDVRYNNLAKVESELMAGALARMKAVDLTYTFMTTAQYTDICHAIQAAGEELELERITLGLGNNKLSEVDGDLLAGAVARIKTVKLATDGPLPVAQATAIFRAVLDEKAGLSYFLFRQFFQDLL